MSIISLPRSRTKHNPAETAIPFASYLSARADRDRRISFAEFAEQAFSDEAFEGMPADWQPARGAEELDHAAVVTTLDELRTELVDAPLPPLAFRNSYDPSWLPSPLRSVPLVDADTSTNDEQTAMTGVHVAAILARVDHVPFARHEDAVREALANVAAMLVEP